MSLVCSKCGSKNPEGARFCKGCGASLAVVIPRQSIGTGDGAAGRRCIGCLVANDASAKFCRGCGSPLGISTVDVARAEAPSTQPVELEPPVPTVITVPVQFDAGEPQTLAAPQAESTSITPSEVESPASAVTEIILPLAKQTEAKTPDTAASPIFHGGVRATSTVMMFTALVLVAFGLGGWYFWGQVGGQGASAALPGEHVSAPAPKPVLGVQTPPVAPLSPSPRYTNDASTPPVIGAPIALPSAQPTATIAEPVPTQADLAAADRARQAQQRLQREERERAAALERQRATLELERQRAEQQRTELARKQTEEAARRAAQLEATRAQPKPPVAASSLTVEGACASAGNIVFREVCRLNECRKASFAADPICVKFRQIEEANRQNRQYQ